MNDRAVNPSFRTALHACGSSRCARVNEHGHLIVFLIDYLLQNCRRLINYRVERVRARSEIPSSSPCFTRGLSRGTRHLNTHKHRSYIHVRVRMHVLIIEIIEDKGFSCVCDRRMKFKSLKTRTGICEYISLIFI